MTSIDPGRFTRAAIHSDAGELELRLSPHGNWQLRLRAADERDWRLACSGDLSGGEITPQAEPNVEPLRLGKLLIDPAARRACVDGAAVKLSVREFELLLTLSAQPERVFTKAELMRKIWGCEALRSSRTLESHASRLRNRLRRAGADGFVLNCHGVGYRLWAGVGPAGTVERAA
jgi:DNA-binding response OmpR family regulator